MDVWRPDGAARETGVVGSPVEGVRLYCTEGGGRRRWLEEDCSGEGADTHSAAYVTVCSDSTLRCALLSLGGTRR